MSRSVRAASHVAVVIASNIGWSSASGGARWSISAMPSKPAASAACARSTMRVHGHPHLRQEEVDLHLRRAHVKSDPPSTLMSAPVM